METALLDALESISCNDYNKFCWCLKNKINCQFPVNPDNRCDLISFFKTKYSINQTVEYFKTALKDASFNQTLAELTQKIAELNDPKNELEMLKQEIIFLKEKIVKLENNFCPNDLNATKKKCVDALFDLTDTEFRRAKFYFCDADFMSGYTKLPRSQLQCERLDLVDRLWNSNGGKIYCIISKICEIVKVP
ncbi:hypothetical protein KM759_gp013 [Lymphocystis disease virus 4]|uniref:Uncharacterized protein n=1 Tax=Lymphocystis disease virus 4 TaxID=2704413 RepID=A0A6B9XMM5_9VIRU|nr:hypothetical protein KM759_gp013 [Lymphocystis disease virus 4]QHR78511.1 hypothetical protein [Lymphocystis disease virus 4]